MFGRAVRLAPLCRESRAAMCTVAESALPKLPVADIINSVKEAGMFKFYEPMLISSFLSIKAFLH